MVCQESWNSKCIFALAFAFVSFAYSTSQSSSLDNARFEDLRRSGRFQCQEQPEDVERLKRQGTIQCKCKKQLFAPVCGSDGRTYHNHCFLTCASKHRYQTLEANHDVAVYLTAITERYISLSRDPNSGSFGFNIKGGIDIGCPVYVWRVESSSIAYENGIKSGNEIISANGISFSELSHSEALKILKTAPNLELEIRSSLPSSSGSFRGEFYTWVDAFGNPVSPPKENDLARAPTRLVDLQIDPGQNLGLMIRGGSEYGLGIFVTGVDPGSVAERGGLKRGDEILAVNSRPFTNITHDKAVATLKSHRKMTLTLAHIGKIPADLTYEPEKTCSIEMIEEKARTVLTKSEHSRFTFYRLEYSQGFLPVQTFVKILLELLNTSEKNTLLTEVREIILPEDKAAFDELIYKPAEMLMDNINEIEPPVENGDLVYLREFKPQRDDDQGVDRTLQKPNHGPSIRFRVRVPKTKPTLGITIEGGSDTSHRLPRIININPDGSCYATHLKPGHVILSCDGKKLDGKTHDEIARTISETFNEKNSIEFVVVENRNNLVVVGQQG